MAQALDLGQRGASRPGRGRLLSDLAPWLAATFGYAPHDRALFERALTHGSLGAESYDRLEFLGDRILGMVMAEWLLDLFPVEPEGELTRRLHHLVSGATCAEVARAIGAPEHLRVNEQAFHDGARASEYVQGDIVESLLAALYLDAGMDAARDWVRRHWAERVHRPTAPRHPKAELQDWALANNKGLPVYTVVKQSGPDHARQHLIAARLGDREETAVASTKREAEAEAARLLLAAIVADQPAPKRKKPALRRRAIVGERRA